MSKSISFKLFKYFGLVIKKCLKWLKRCHITLCLLPFISFYFDRNIFKFIFDSIERTHAKLLQAKFIMRCQKNKYPGNNVRTDLASRITCNSFILRMSCFLSHQINMNIYLQKVRILHCHIPIVYNTHINYGTNCMLAFIFLLGRYFL